MAAIALVQTITLQRAVLAQVQETIQTVRKIANAVEAVTDDFYYKYYVTQSPFIGEKCMDCELLPSCLYSASCIQKKIENFKPECRKDMIMQSVKNDIACKVRKNSIRQ